MADETMPDEMPAEEFKPLRLTATAEGNVGGESHDAYSVHAVEGQTMTVEMSSDENNAGFSVSTGPDFFSGEVVELGVERETAGSRTVSGKVPQTGVYLIFVTAHPVADYKLRVTLE